MTAEREAMTDTNFQAHQRETERLLARVYETETKAGIREAHAAFNEASSNNALRRLYFSVRDNELRKELITRYRTLMRHEDGYTRSRLLDAEQDLRSLELKVFSPPWVVPAILVAVAVWAGWAFAGMPGAMAGAVAGFFLGNAYIGERRNVREREVAYAKAEIDELRDEQKMDQEYFGNRYVFSEQEEDSGSEDEGAQPEPDIHWFSRLGDADLVKGEIDKGVSVDSENNESWGSRPLHRAADNCNPGVVRVLLDAGADPKAANRLHGFTPLHSAAAAGCAEVVRLLLEAGSPADAKDKYDYLPLHRAAESGDAETIRLLVGAGTSVEAEGGPYRKRPLHDAAQAGHVDAVRTLLELGADPSAGNSDGVTPLDFASYGEGARFDETAAVLKAAGGVRGKSGS